MAHLPPIGAEIPLSQLATNTPFEYQGKTHTLDFRGGLKYRVDVNPNDPINSVRLQIVGHRVSAQMDGEGSITIEQNDVDVDAKSLLKQVQQFPPKYEQIFVLPFTATIQADGGEPVVLTTKEPALLKGTLTNYLPRGDLHVLEKPVDLVAPDAPHRVLARIPKFPVKMGAP